MQDALYRGLGAQVLEQLAPEYPILRGDVISLSNFGKTMWDPAISWTSAAMVGNYILTQDAPFVRSELGTVQIIEEPRLNTVPILREGIKIHYNNEFYRVQQHQGSFIDWYTMAMTAKVQAADALLNNVILYGNPNTGTPGLLQNSGIPIINSSVNMSLASSDAVINEVVRLATLPANNSLNLFRPTKIAIPQNLFNILNNRSYSTTNSESLLQVVERRLSTAAGYNRPGDPKFTLTSVTHLNPLGIMTLLPEDANLIGACIFDLEETTSNEAGIMGQNGDLLGESWNLGYAGVIAKRPYAGLIINLTY